MRTIKFRGKVEYPQKYFGDKDIPNGRWIVGDLHLNWCYPHIHIDTKDKYPINPNTVGQFTGLHDKNGKEIYEGDIVRYSLDGRKDVGYIGFHTRSASFRVIAEHTDFGIGNRGELHELNLEVIGNIHDNLELLKWNRQ